ncbi:DUF3598 domain-containing protein [Hirschia litorea]|uniref:DUF3598 domain-containing protein n=1 Tax=Hirschia litorea TaxID=1199156 RepID=A0ABW2INN4_9PROT
MISLRDSFPLLARHEGIWEGWYRYIDVDGNQIDAHRSRLICRIPDDTPNIYHQTNHYTWEDGRTDIRDFKGHAEGVRLIFNNDIIKGWSAEEPLDEHRRTMMLHWTRVGEPEIYLYEMIQLSDCGNFRTRVWQWLKNGKTVQRTLIDEERISHEWRGE